MGGEALPPLHPPCWPAVGQRRGFERFAIRSPNNNNNNNNDFGRGGAAPPHPPYWPAVGRRGILERLHLSVVLMDGGSGGALPPRTPPAGRPLASGEASSASPSWSLNFHHFIIGINVGLPPRTPPAGRPSGNSISSASPFGRLTRRTPSRLRVIRIGIRGLKVLS